MKKLKPLKAVASLLRVQSLLQRPASQLQELGIRLVREDEAVVPVHAQDDLLVTNLTAGTSRKKDLSDFGIAKTISTLFVVTETSGETGRPGRAEVGPRLAMTENVIVIGRADAAAPGPKLVTESVTGSTAAIDANETGTVIEIGTVIESETETATEKETEIGIEIVTVTELIGIVIGTATETETVIGIVTASWTAGMTATPAVIWIAAVKESRHEKGLQKGTEIVAEKKTKTATDHGLQMIAHGQDHAAAALHPTLIDRALNIVVIGQVLVLLLADDLNHDEDHALRLIGMSRSPAPAVDLLVVEHVHLNARETGNETAHVSKNGTGSLVVTGTFLELLQ